MRGLSDPSQVGSGGISARKPFRMTAEVSRLAVQAIVRSTEEALDEDSLSISLRLEFGGQSPFPPESRYVTPDGTISPVRMFPFLWDSVAACSRLVRSLSSEEEAKLHPTFYALLFRREGSAGRVAIFSWERGEREIISEIELPLSDLAGACWSLADSVLSGVVQYNPLLKGNLSIQRFSETVHDLLELLLQRGWRGPV